MRINVERSGEIGQLVAANYKSSIILVPLQEKIAETGAAYRLPRACPSASKQLRGKYESDKVAIHVTGFAKVVGDLIDGLHAGSGVLRGRHCHLHRGAVLVHPLPGAARLLVVLCSMVAVVWLLGLLPTLGYELDPVLGAGALSGVRHRHEPRRAENERHHAGHWPWHPQAWWPHATPSAACSWPA